MSQPDKTQVLLGLLKQLVTGQNIKQAESQLEQFQSQPGFGTALLQVLSNSNIDGMCRQQSGMLLKLLIQNHWEPTDSRFKPPQINPNEKASLRNAILNQKLLGDSDSKIRKTTALIISMLADYDYPESWPNLLEQLLQFVQRSAGKNIHLLSGSVYALTYFVEHIDQVQMPAIVPTLFPLLLNIVNSKALPADVRMHGFTIFLTLLSTTLDMRTEQPKLVKDLLHPTLFDWLKSLHTVFSEKNVTTFDVQIEAVTALNRLCRDYPRGIATHLGNILPSLWQSVVFATKLWHFLCVQSEEERKQEFNAEVIKALSEQSVSPSQAEDEIVPKTVRFLETSFLAFDSILSHPKSEFRNLLDNKLSDLSRIILQLTMLTHEHLELFEAEPNEFASGELNIYSAGDLRGSMRNLMGRILDLCPKKGYDSLLQSAQQLLAQSNKTRQKRVSYWWREREAAIIGFEALADAVADISEFAPQQVKFPIEEFIPKVIYPDIEQKSEKKPNMFLRSRALWCLSHFVPLINAQNNKAMVRNLCACFTPDNCNVVRCAASRVFESLLETKNSELNEAILPLLDNLIPLLCQLMTASKSAALRQTLACLRLMINVDEKKTVAMEGNIVPLLLKTWKNNAEDENVFENINAVIESFLKYPQCIDNVRKHVIPTIIQLIDNRSRVQSGVITDALQVVTLLADPTPDRVRIAQIKMSSQLEQQSKSESLAPSVPIPDGFYTEIMPRIVTLVYETNDHEMMEEGAKLIATLIRLNPKKVAQSSIKMKQGEQPMIKCILQVVQKLLHPSITDDAALGVGPLMTQLLINLGSNLNQSILSEMLITVVRRMSLAYTTAVRQQLLIVIARLVHLHGLQIIHFLANNNGGSLTIQMRKKGRVDKENFNSNGGIESINSKARLQDVTVKLLPHVMESWCDGHNDLTYPYFKKLSIMALCKLLETKDKYISAVTVPGYPIIDINAPRATRSRGPPTIKYSEMPLPVKILQLAITTWQDLCATQDSSSEAEFDADDDEEYETSPSRSYRTNNSSIRSTPAKPQQSTANNNNNAGINAGISAGIGVGVGVGGAEDSEEEDDWIPTKEELEQYKTYDPQDLLHYGRVGCDAELEECPDAIDDPLYWVDMREYLCNFVKQLSLMDNGAVLKNLGNHLQKEDQRNLVTIINWSQQKPVFS